MVAIATGVQVFLQIFKSTKMTGLIYQGQTNSIWKNDSRVKQIRHKRAARKMIAWSLLLLWPISIICRFGHHTDIMLSITHSYFYVFPVIVKTQKKAQVGPLLTWRAEWWGIKRLAVSTVRPSLTSSPWLRAVPLMLQLVKKRKPTDFQ